eukprot:9841664-Lingulodinium_polyedra.AAC.1
MVLSFEALKLAQAHIFGRQQSSSGVWGADSVRCRVDSNYLSRASLNKRASGVTAVHVSSHQR